MTNEVFFFGPALIFDPSAIGHARLQTANYVLHFTVALPLVKQFLDDLALFHAIFSYFPQQVASFHLQHHYLCPKLTSPPCSPGTLVQPPHSNSKAPKPHIREMAARFRANPCALPNPFLCPHISKRSASHPRATKKNLDILLINTAY